MLSRINYLTQLVNHYLDEQSGLPIKKQLGRIKSRLNSDTVYLAVVGEFSCGKSTFINALLRKRLLKESFLPTTAFATMLECSPSLLLRTSFKKQRTSYTATPDSFNKLQSVIYDAFGKQCNSFKEILDVITSDQEVAQHVRSIKLGVPDTNIPKNLQLIDTPGFNPDQGSYANHFDITRKVVEEVADMAVILIPPDQAMTSSLINFIADNLQRCLHRCIFVVTKMDNKEQQDRQEILSFVYQQLKQKFGLNEPLVYDLSAITMLPVKKIPARLQEEWPIWQQKFVSFEQQTWSLLEKKGKIVLSESIYSILAQVLKTLAISLKKKKELSRETLALLHNCRLANVDNVTAQAIAQALRDIEVTANSIRSKAANLIGKKTAYSYSMVDSIIDATKNNLIDFEDKEKAIINARLKELTIQIVDELNSSHLPRLQDSVNDQLQAISRGFSSHYTMFPMLKQTMKKQPSISVASIAISYADFTSTKAFIKEKIDETNKGTTTGAVVGGTIGFLLGGPLVALLGVALGGGGGAIISDNEDDRKKGAKSRLHLEISNHFAQVKKQIEQALAEVMSNIKGTISKFGQAHIRNYGSQIKELIQKQQEKESALQREIVQINNHIAALEDMQDKVGEELAILRLK